MKTKVDTVNVQLDSNDYRISQKNDKIIVIEQKDKPDKPKAFYESSIFVILIVPIIIIIINHIFIRLWFRKKEKKESVKLQNEIDKLVIEKDKINQDIIQLKSSFQPIVLSSLQKIQENILKDKIKVLQDIVVYRTNLFYLEQNYYQGQEIIGDEHEYYDLLYQGFSRIDLTKIGDTITLNGYLFPDMIKNKLDEILFDLRQIINIQNREYSMENSNMPFDAYEIFKRTHNSFFEVVELIRKDLHLDENFIHDFINRYKVIN